MRGVVVALLALVLLFSGLAHAHAASDGYLTLVFSDSPEVVGTWDLARTDVAASIAFGPGHGAGGELSREDVLARKDDIAAFALGHLGIRGDDAPCPTTPGELSFTEHADQAYISLRFTASCRRSPRVVALDYELFFDKDPLHRGLTRIDDGDKPRSIVFSKGYRHEQFTRSERNRPAELGGAIRSGVEHIASGIDHLLFLLALLLPAVLRREEGKWRPVATFREAAVEVAKIVTAFTVAHSLTLSLSVLDVVRLSPRFIEPAIAASIIVAALQNVVRPSGHGRWRVAFVLGLLHGFGFSAALLDLGLAKAELVTTLFGFNLGVELGQLAVVAIFLPVAFRLRAWPRYRPLVLDAGSILIAVIACVWFVQRLR
jgi:hypothetical protein